MLVDDNAVDREMLSRRLTRRGYVVRESGNGAEALEQLRLDPAHIVLLDTSLPGLDGFALTRELKADSATRRIPVVVLTAHALVQHKEQALAAGCDAFETKPVELARLLATMEALLGAD
jgi:CheY-like chemotaxis protein